jgi:hypothetical protein
MKKLFPLVTLAACALISSSALAAGTDYHVFILNGAQEVSVGDWDLVLDQDVEISSPDADACRYFVKWENDATIKSQARLQVDEFQAVGFEDCEYNAENNFHTFMQLAGCPTTHKGFDKNQQKKTVNFLVLGADGEDGELNGIIQLNGGAFYGFEAEF